MNDIIQQASDLSCLTAAIVSAYVTKNNVPAYDLPGFITATHAALVKLTAPAALEIEKPTPPVPIRRTVTPDHIISLEDGRPYKSLKRHLMTRGLTPAEYRQKWGLPSDYPMVAANYAALRSELAKGIGLGQIRHARAAAQMLESQSKAVELAPVRRGRPKKAAATAAE